MIKSNHCPSKQGHSPSIVKNVPARRGSRAARSTISGARSVTVNSASSHCVRMWRVSKPVPQPISNMRGTSGRSEEHTSELQSLMRISYAVFCLKKKNNKKHKDQKYPHKHNNK